MSVIFECRLSSNELWHNLSFLVLLVNVSIGILTFLFQVLSNEFQTFLMFQRPFLKN